MANNYHRYHDMMQSIVDSLALDPDPNARLAYIQQLNIEARRMLMDARDEAAYDLRQRFAGDDAEILSGVSRRYIDYWAKRWQRRKNLPPLKAKQRVDLTNVIDLSGGGRFPTNRPR